MAKTYGGKFYYICMAKISCARGNLLHDGMAAIQRIF